MRSAFIGKISGDLKSLAGRLVLLSAAVGVGVLVLAAIAASASTLLREMEKSYEETSPATATFELEEPIDAAWAESLRGSWGIEDARAGDSFQIRFRDGKGQWQPMVLFVVPSLAENRIATVRPEGSTPWPPRRGNLALERTAFPTFGLEPGEKIELRFADGRAAKGRLESVVHDPGVAPAYQERTAYAYVEAETARDWGLEVYRELKVRLDQGLAWDEARRAALSIAAELEELGIAVEEVRVPPVHRHPHQGILVTLLLILAAFGFLTVVLCSLLAANTIAALIAKEKRWIAVMKTIGASGGRILTATLAPVLVLGVASTAWSVPLGIVAAKAFSPAVASLLNFSLRDGSVEWWGYALPVAVGLVVPLLMTLIPARKVRRMTIMEALCDAGTEETRYSERRSAWSVFLMGANPAAGLAWRNSLRKKRRLALSLLLLGLGGGLFITGFNLRASWNALLAESFAARKMDFQIRLASVVGEEDRAILGGDAGEVEALEVWPSILASTVVSGSLSVEATYPDKAHGSFRAFSVAPDTKMIRFPAISGRALPGPGEAVLNQSAALRFPGARVGDKIDLVLGGEVRKLRLAGVVRELGQAAAYLEHSELRSYAGHRDYRSEVLLALREGVAADHAKERIELRLEERGLPVELLIDNREFEAAGGEHFGLLIAVILALGIVTGTVGWFGIASMLGLAVTERRREFGIIRSIGGTPGDLLAAIVAEATVMTVLGAAAAAILSIPISYGLGSYLGNLSARMPLPLVVDLPMAGLWLAASLPAGIIASLGAALRAARISVRETLNYL